MSENLHTTAGQSIRASCPTPTHYPKRRRARVHDFHVVRSAVCQHLLVDYTHIAIFVARRFQNGDRLIGVLRHAVHRYHVGLLQGFLQPSYFRSERARQRLSLHRS